jgi:hypothetical protein
LKYQETNNETINNCYNWYAALAQDDDDDEEEEEEEDDEINPEMILVGAGIGSAFQHTDELKPIQYKEAMKSMEKDKWEEAVHTEYTKIQAKGVLNKCQLITFQKKQKY